MNLKHYYIKFLVTAIYSLLLWNTVYAQDRCVNIIDDNGRAVQYANVRINYIPEDNAQATYLVSDSLGNIHLNTSCRIMNLHVTAVGYVDYNARVDTDTLNQINMKCKDLMLHDVEVVGSRPMVFSDGKSLTLTVENTLLSKLMSFNDVLRYVPFVIDKDGNTEIMGRGNPEFRINGHHASSDEIQNLSPTNIKNIKLILFPGAEYSSSTKAVVNIILHHHDSGFNGTASTSIFCLGGKLSENIRSAVNYTRNKRDVFITLNMRDTRNRTIQDQLMELSGDDGKWTQDERRVTTRNWLGFDGTIGTNYVSEKLEYGIKGEFTLSPHIDEFSNASMTLIENKCSSKSLINSVGTDKTNAAKYGLNGYLSWNPMENMSVDVEDYMSNHANKCEQLVTETAYDCSNKDVSNNGNYNYFTNSIRLKAQHDISDFTLEYGFENTYNKYNSEYIYLSETIVPSSEIHRRELHTAAFVQGSYNLPFIEISAGLRYEHSDVTITPITEQSEWYRDDLYPNIILTSNIGKFTFGFDYEYDTEWPGYGEMRNSVEYISSFEYESGNPLLKTKRTHSFDLFGSYKNLNVMLGYEHQLDAVIRTYEQYGHQNIVLRSFNNADVLDNLTLSINWNGKIKFWGLYASAMFTKPFLKYNNHTYNKPSVNASLNNTFTVSKSLSFILNATARTTGNNDLWFDKPTGEVQAGVLFSCCKGKLNAGLYYMDIFRTSNNGMSMDTPQIMIDKNVSKNTNGVCLSVSYNFNYKQERFKQVEVGEKEKNRIF